MTHEMTQCNTTQNGNEQRNVSDEQHDGRVGFLVFCLLRGVAMGNNVDIDSAILRACLFHKLLDDGLSCLQVRKKRGPVYTEKGLATYGTHFSTTIVLIHSTSSKKGALLSW